MGFVLQGVLRVCYYSRQGQEITRSFLAESELVTDLRGLEYGMTSAEYVQAVTECRLLVFAKRDWQELARAIDNWRDLLREATTQHLRAKLARLSPLLTQDATTRYQEFVAHYPHLATRVPLAHLATYLGITPSSLSRIRRQRR